jgi:hypothetical protein
LKLVAHYFPVHAERRIQKHAALKNMDALVQEYADVLLFEKSHDMKRFAAPAYEQGLLARDR